jgi:peroxiredoxin Q/BCP
MTSPTLRIQAPQFTTLNQRNESVNLSDYIGKVVVLYFYPKALTEGCINQACGLRDSQKEIEKHNAVVLGISPDAPKLLTKFVEKKALNFDLLADEDHAIADDYGVWGLKKFMGKEYMGLIRTTFIIDENGNLESILHKFKTKTHHETVLNYLDSRSKT